ncbi:beta-ketoacyl-[acyl-carrier-protein] synthase family protein [Aeoliella mucimassa]|uniref:3-oxoacyl-[acyl-carrier-protein] synthase 2 n=1 Tax=Aeoliella mucimassa TaxID=2527972 RepID=A0A518AH48_9BACT|nr:beta-ketoacyl-[acyl-carrier-protein] synthase family protein [Aeoliella mucimassa]QDU54047.1 3-oxoacyl-[acyl-carrier-protein] synthase 2 [Aeoliella mucimassa]
MEDVLITGLGIVSPIGIGREAVRSAIESRTSGITTIDDYAKAGWLAPYGGRVTDFEPKEYVKPRKSMKVMAHEIQMAFAAAEMAVSDAGLEEGSIDPERSGVVLGAGSMYCDLEELVDAYRSCSTEQGFDFNKWGDAAKRELFPLWMLKYLPNMPACHIGIRHDARGPTNTISHGEISSLLALAEAMQVIRRGQADVMFVGGTSTRLSITDLVWHGGARMAHGDLSPAEACRPFDAKRQGMVMGEGAAVMVLESRTHAERRGQQPLARVLSVATRSCQTAKRFDPPVPAIENALSVALERAEIAPSELAHINAHGLGTLEDDPAEAQAIAKVLDGADVPVTSPKSYFGNLGAGCGAMELVVSLLAANEGAVPPTLNHEQTDPACPVRVAAETEATTRKAFAALNHTNTGQAVAAILACD